MHPIALQIVHFKWLTTVVLMQIQDALQVVVPAAQTGFVRGRQMLYHVMRARLLWEELGEGQSPLILPKHMIQWVICSLKRHCGTCDCQRSMCDCCTVACNSWASPSSVGSRNSS